MDNHEQLTKEVASLREQVEEQGIRLTLAQAWQGLMLKAYDALLNYGVNYRSLPEYEQDQTLDESMDLPISKARNNIIGWLGRLENAISAAVRRKTFRLVD